MSGPRGVYIMPRDDRAAAHLDVEDGARHNRERSRRSHAHEDGPMTRQEPTEAELLAVVQEVSAHAAKMTARAMAWQRARAVRDVAATLARCAATVDRLALTGAERLRPSRCGTPVSRTISTRRCALDSGPWALRTPACVGRTRSGRYPSASSRRAASGSSRRA